MGPKRSLMIKNCSVDNFGPFLTALDPYGMLTSHVGQRFAFFGPTQPQSVDPKVI